jgi:hypothetical protein
MLPRLERPLRSSEAIALQGNKIHVNKHKEEERNRCANGTPKNYEKNNNMVTIRPVISYIRTVPGEDAMLLVVGGEGRRWGPGYSVHFETLELFNIILNKK